MPELRPPRYLRVFDTGGLGAAANGVVTTARVQVFGIAAEAYAGTDAGDFRCHWPSDGTPTFSDPVIAAVNVSAEQTFAMKWLNPPVVSENGIEWAYEKGASNNLRGYIYYAPVR